MMREFYDIALTNFADIEGVVVKKVSLACNADAVEVSMTVKYGGEWYIETVESFVDSEPALADAVNDAARFVRDDILEEIRLANLPKVYVATRPHSWATNGVHAVAFDCEGNFLADHISINLNYARWDMGAHPDSDRKHDIYDEAYPDGWGVEWIGEDFDAAPFPLDTLEVHDENQ